MFASDASEKRPVLRLRGTTRIARRWPAASRWTEAQAPRALDPERHGYALGPARYGQTSAKGEDRTHLLARDRQTRSIGGTGRNLSAVMASLASGTRNVVGTDCGTRL